MKTVKIFGKTIPLIAIIAIISIVVLVSAATLIIVTQHITQTIQEEPVTPEYGIITAPAIQLSDVSINQNFAPWNQEDYVTVETIYVGKTLKLELTGDTSLYDAYEVKLTLASKPAGSGLVVGTSHLTVNQGQLVATMPLSTIGTYTFDELVTGTTGSAAGLADVIVTLTLEGEEE